MEFQLLGPVEARHTARNPGRRVALSGSKVHTVLATLLLARGRVVGDGRLSELLWGWDPPATMNAQIYTYISRLRKLLGSDVELIRRQPGYQLLAEGARLDVVEFEELDRRGRRALEERRFADAADALRRALDLWQGPALAGVTPYLAEAEVPQLEEARVTALEHRVEADLALGRHQRLVSELTGLVSEFPVRERLRAQLMTALYRSGRQADALHVYHEGRTVLAEELGVDPGPDLTTAYQGALSGDLGRLPEPARVSVTASGTARRTPPLLLPPDVADFTGRRREFEELCAALVPAPAERRLPFRPRRLLINGMAGVGKTALAVRVAHAVAGEFPDGLLYARLRHENGAVKDSGVVLAQLLSTLGERPEDVPVPGGGPGRLDELVHRWRTRTAGRRLLVVLDDAANELQLDTLLPATAEAAVLVTSRGRLSTVPGSHGLTLEPLGDTESLALLGAVAGPARIGVEPEAARLIVRACAGLPLALRIAGTRLAARPHWPAARLARRLADPACRTEELRVGELDVRHTLSTALGQRPRDEREFVTALAPHGTEAFTTARAARFAGIAEEVAEELLERLVEAALLEMAGIDATGEPRYRFHELVRLVATGQPERDGDLTLTGT
ncbi:BTAD domain-containing putative transcriptional regulator [Streptomyces sp. P17]|uniref:AfsR/SARP family transcriptional regulator n=1 Tax=Streptomyces sp. P17 TaxID=3074716 RepID=UPI0028F45DDF|nr:BTAD domain-containing putative transcriptional regulator [Streptomyces sp. P17]MDT9701655.1 BTAD domain-containing putative transcriptional regulator [Streptomyces sp. P17]